MGKSEIIQKLVDEIATKNNTIDLDAYAKGANDMFDILKAEYKEEQKQLDEMPESDGDIH